MQKGVHIKKEMKCLVLTLDMNSSKLYPIKTQDADFVFLYIFFEIETCISLTVDISYIFNLIKINGQFWYKFIKIKFDVS